MHQNTGSADAGQGAGATNNSGAADAGTQTPPQASGDSQALLERIARLEAINKEVVADRNALKSWKKEKEQESLSTAQQAGDLKAVNEKLMARLDEWKPLVEEHAALKSEVEKTLEAAKAEADALRKKLTKEQLAQLPTLSDPRQEAQMLRALITTKPVVPPSSGAAGGATGTDLGAARTAEEVLSLAQKADSKSRRAYLNEAFSGVFGGVGRRSG